MEAKACVCCGGIKNKAVALSGPRTILYHSFASALSIICLNKTATQSRPERTCMLESLQVEYCFLAVQQSSVHRRYLPMDMLYVSYLLNIPWAYEAGAL